jgi:hypothetical protein
MTDNTFRPELDGSARFKAMHAIAEWKPNVMES